MKMNENSPQHEQMQIDRLLGQTRYCRPSTSRMDVSEKDIGIPSKADLDLDVVFSGFP